ncbi:MAG: hypothetical protein ACXAC8_08380 [Candidatus Hodarchaeales archaeon]|jgi:hypothetical protein
MRDNSSVFVVFPSNILEICFSRNELDNSNKGINVSQFLFLLASQFLLLVVKLGTNWKKWLFFVLQTGIGEGFRIDSCRDYPGEFFTKRNVERFFINEYEIVVNIQSNSCKLRIDPNVKTELSTLLKEHQLKELLHAVDVSSISFTSELQNDKIRTLDLKLMIKRSYLIRPPLSAVHKWIIRWKPLKSKEYVRLVENDLKINEIDFSKLPIFFSEKELFERGWDNYRNPSLEQSWGLICPNCKMNFESNIHAKSCISCQTPLKKA